MTEDQSNIDPNTDNQVGEVYLTGKGTGVGFFDFVTQSETQVGIDSAVVTENETSSTLGIVTDMRIVGPDISPLHVLDLDLESRVTDEPNQAMVATAQVYTRSLQPVRRGKVRMAHAEELQAALNEGVKKPVPVGIIPTNEGYAKVCVDEDNLLGPESGHMMIGGRSGAASKTSFALTLLNNAMQSSNNTVSAVVFNVKGTDLLYLDKPNPDLTEQDLQLYKALGVEPKPFENVFVWAPSNKGWGVNSARQDALPIKWNIKDAWYWLSYMAPSLTANDAGANLMAELGTHIVEKPGTTFDTLINFLTTQLEEAQDSSTAWRGHHVATIRKVLKTLNGLQTRAGGLISTGSESTKVDLSDLDYGSVIVVDISKLEPEIQSVLVAATMGELWKKIEKEDRVNKKTVVFVDELNIYAGRDADHGLKRNLTRISATGRYAGVSLWGAAQFLSAVDSQIRDNASNMAYGILAESEIETGIYGRLTPGQKQQAATLEKGEMVVKAYNLRGPVKVKFPRPSCASGIGKIDKEVTPDVKTETLTRLKEGLDEKTVDGVLTRADGNIDKAILELEKLRDPDMSKVSVEVAAELEIDEWGLD